MPPRHHVTKRRTGLQWSTEEEMQLTEEVAKCMTLRNIALNHLRSIGSIMKRIVKLGLFFNAPEQTKQKEVYELKTLEINEPAIIAKTLVCIFDTETTGLTPFKPITQSDAWPRMVQFACEIYDNGALIRKWSTYIIPDGFVIPEESIKIHHITNDIAKTGITLDAWCGELMTFLPRVHTLVAHNMMFDNNIIQSELFRAKKFDMLTEWKRIHKECTMMMGKRYLSEKQIKSQHERPLKLVNLCHILTIPVPDEEKLHSADVDTELCATLYTTFKGFGISNNRHDLPSLYKDRDILKHLGARWDSGQKTWYIYDDEPFSSYAKKLFFKDI